MQIAHLYSSEIQTKPEFWEKEIRIILMTKNNRDGEQTEDKKNSYES